MLHFPDWLLKRDWALMKSVPDHQKVMLPSAGRPAWACTEGKLAPLVICPLKHWTGFLMRWSVRERSP